MVGLETVVRPVILPDIRPRARQSLPPQDDPDKGLAKIAGQPATQVSLSYSMSISSSKKKPVETERRVDETRVYQMEDDGTVNKENFVDLQVANRITMREPVGAGGGGFVGFNGDDVVPTIPGRGFTGDDLKPHYYQPVQEDKNIEVKRRNVILRNGEEFQG